MKDYKTNNYQGHKTAPEMVVLVILVGYLVVNLSVDEISRFFGF